MGTIKLGADRVFIGMDALDGLNMMANKRVAIIESGSINAKLGYRKQVVDKLASIGATCIVYDDVEPEPCFETINEGKRVVDDFQPDWIIGFGGGSALDAAKAIWVFYENDIASFADLLANGGIRTLRSKARLACIPTSSGTGSEVTKAAIIKDNATHRKYPIADMQWRLIPDCAILFPPFTYSMPASLTAACGMDAMTHAIEAYTSIRANNFSDAMACGAFRLIAGNLKVAFSHPQDACARQNMLEGSCMAGIAFTNSSLGIAHAISHAIGGYTGLAHGLVNAIILPYVIEYNSQSEETQNRYIQLASMIGESNLGEYVGIMNDDLCIPRCICEALGDGNILHEKLDAIVENALADVNLKGNAVSANGNQMRELIIRACDGE